MIIKHFKVTNLNTGKNNAEADLSYKANKPFLYSDWAINNFLEKANKRAWFDNTIFVGKVYLPVNRYHIPLRLNRWKNYE